jgi:hypothetical protein
MDVNPFGDSFERGNSFYINKLRSFNINIDAMQTDAPIFNRCFQSPVLDHFEELSFSYVWVLGNTPLQARELMPTMLTST